MEALKEVVLTLVAIQALCELSALALVITVFCVVAGAAAWGEWRDGVARRKSYAEYVRQRDAKNVRRPRA